MKRLATAVAFVGSMGLVFCVPSAQAPHRHIDRRWRCLPLAVCRFALRMILVELLQFLGRSHQPPDLLSLDR
jgi:hypothetical protein